jgi:hypothetical protein
MRDLEETTRPDILLLKYDIDAMRERWLRTEHKYDQIQSAQKQLNTKIDMVIILQLFISLLLGTMLL